MMCSALAVDDADLAVDDAASDDDSDYKAITFEDSDSDGATAAAALLAKPNPGGGTEKNSSKCKGRDAKNTAMQAKKTPPAKKAKTPTEKVCLFIFLIMI